MRYGSKMLKSIGVLVLLAGISFGLTGCSGNDEKSDQTHIAVASNFIVTAEKLLTEFSQKTDYDYALVPGSTGQLYSQIKYGAPFDIFLAADQTRPLLLEENGLGVPGSRFTYAKGGLVLYCVQGDCENETALGRSDLRALAIANPEIAPYGIAAMQVLSNLELDKTLKNNIVFAENVSQSFGFVETGNAQLGFVARSQVVVSGKSDQSYWAIPDDLYETIAQDAILLKQTPQSEAFYKFLRSPVARQIIERDGYKTGS